MKRLFSIEMNLFGFEVNVVFLVGKETILAYSWHYNEEKARQVLRKIAEFHKIEGEVLKSLHLEKWLKNEVDRIVLKGEQFKMPDFEYRNRIVYENIINIPAGKTETYAAIARKSNVKFPELLITLMRNPFQILIPCHRLVTKRGTLMGFYPLGKNVKKKILEVEGVRIDE